MPENSFDFQLIVLCVVFCKKHKNACYNCMVTVAIEWTHKALI